jgi:hypothetical protein
VNSSSYTSVCSFLLFVYGEISKCRERVFCVGEMEKFLFVSFAWSLVVAARDFVRFVFGLVSELCGCRY